MKQVKIQSGEGKNGMDSRIQFRKPDYWDRFQCTASACSDNCCIGWEVDIDPDTREYYKTVAGPFGRILDDGIQDTDEGSMFRLKGKEERCVFLNEKNLCELQIHLGGGSLCDICREHPRYYEWIGDTTEAGIGMCCEAAALLILGREERDRFLVEEQEGVPDETPYDEIWYQELYAFRERSFLEMADRSRPVRERIGRILELAAQMNGDPQDQKAASAVKRLLLPVEDGETSKDGNSENREFHWKSGISGDDEGRWKNAPSGNHAGRLREMLEFLQTLEPMSEDWHPLLSRISQNLDRLLTLRDRFRAISRSWEYEYEHLAVYYLYRYTMKAVFDGDLMSRILFVAASVLIQELMDMDSWLAEDPLTLTERAAHARKYSKEIEYCEENLEAFLEYLSSMGDTGKMQEYTEEESYD